MLFKLLALLLTLFYFNPTQAQIYFGPGIGFSRFTNDRLNSYSQVSSGPRFGGVLGYHIPSSPLAVETFYNYTNTKTSELKFNNSKYVYHAKIQSFGLVGKYFIGMIHFRLGYGFHQFNTYVTDFLTGTEQNNPTIESEFGVIGKKFYSGPLFGAGLDLPLGSIKPYVVLTSYQLNSTNSDIFEFEAGLKFSF
jgi:hypothetical protein